MAHPLITVVNSRHRLRSRWLYAVGFTAICIAGGITAALLGGHGGLPLVVTAAALGMLMLPYAAFTATSLARDIREWLLREPSGIWQILALFLAVYLVYAVGTDSFTFSALGRLVAFMLVPTVLIYKARLAKEITWWDFIAVACIWLPFDMGLLKQIWSWPAGEGAYLLNTILAINLVMVLFVGLRGMTGIRLRYQMNAKEFGLVIALLLAFMIIAIPFGLATGFLTWAPTIATTPVVKIIGTMLGILLFIAIPEELLFRGLVQNFLQKKLGHPVWALITASIFFGATHLNNEPLMDWRYFTLASIAGLFYGVAYLRSRSLFVPAALHALVDILWVFFFHV